MSEMVVGLIILGVIFLGSSIAGYFAFKKMIEDLTPYLAIGAVIIGILLLFWANKKWNIFGKIKGLKK